MQFNRLSSYATNKGEKGKMTDFHESWPDWSTHGWGWPCKVFWTWGHPNRFWESTLIVDLHLNTNFSLPQPIFFCCSPFWFWCEWKFLPNMGTVNPYMCDSGTKKARKIVRFWWNFVCILSKLQTITTKNFIKIEQFFSPFLLMNRTLLGWQFPYLVKIFHAHQKSNGEQ